MKQMHCLHSYMSVLHCRSNTPASAGCELAAILLVVFDTVMQGRNMTRAGQRLGFSSIQHPVWGVDVTTDPHGFPVPSVVSSTGAPTVAGGVPRVPVVDGIGLSVPNVDGNTLGVGTTTNGLTPALPISTEPSGIPVRATLPGAVDDIAAVDEALPLGLAPQITPLLGNEVPIPIPPPSYVLAPDIPDEDVGLPTAEHVVPTPAIPAVPSVSGLSPGDASSVAPKGNPVGGTDAPGIMPSGEVAAIPGVGVPIPPTCEKAGENAELELRRAATTVAVHRRFISVLLNWLSPCQSIFLSRSRGLGRRVGRGAP
jgi:hypothetical protein